MKAKRIAGLTFLLFVSAVATCGQPQSSTTPLSISLPGQAWAVQIDAPGFAVKIDEMKPDGRKYFVAENGNTKVILSVFLEKADSSGASKDCRENLRQRAKAETPYKKKDIRFGQRGEMQTLEYTVPEYQGHALQQRSLFACIKKGDVYVDIHLSKTSFKPEDEQLFAAVLDTVRLAEQGEPAAQREGPAAGSSRRETPPQSGPSLRGTLTDANGPITDAQLILQRFRDEKCAKLMDSREYSERNAKELAACSQDLSPVQPDEKGEYHFASLQPGWYALRMLWNINPKPNRSPVAFPMGSFVIMYAGHKDQTGRYDALAQGRPFHFSGREDVALDFHYEKPWAPPQRIAHAPRFGGLLLAARGIMSGCLGRKRALRCGAPPFCACARTPRW